MWQTWRRVLETWEKENYIALIYLLLNLHHTRLVCILKMNNNKETNHVCPLSRLVCSIQSIWTICKQQEATGYLPRHALGEPAPTQLPWLKPQNSSKLFSNIIYR